MRWKSRPALWTTLGIAVMWLGLSACGSSSSSGGGSRAVVLPPANGSTMVTKSAIAPGATCATGGTHIDWGVDANGNGVLDPAEIAGRGDICNGVAGKDAGVMEIQVQPAVQPWPASGIGSNYYSINYYQYDGMNATGWTPPVSDGAGGWTTLDTGGISLPYGAYLISNTTGSTQTVDLSVDWYSDIGSLAMYNGAFDPMAPTTNLVAVNEAANYDCMAAPWGGDNSYCGNTYFNRVTMTLANGESRTVVATSYYPWDYASTNPINYEGYDLIVASSESVAAAGGASGNIGSGMLHWYQLTGLTPSQTYTIAVTAAGYAHGDVVDGYISDESQGYWDSYWGSGTYTTATSGIEVTASDMPADENGNVYVAVYGSNVTDVGGGAYTLSVLPGYEATAWGGDHGTAFVDYPYMIGSVDLGLDGPGVSNYTVVGALNSGAIGNVMTGDKYTITLTNVSDPGTTVTGVTTTGGGSHASVSCPVVAAKKIACPVLTIPASDTGITFNVDGTGTTAGATYNILVTAASTANGVGGETIGLTMYGNVANTTTKGAGLTTWNDTWTAAVVGGTYFVNVSVDDPAVTVAVVDDATVPVAGACDPAAVDQYGIMSIGCTITTGAASGVVSVTLDGVATANGSEFNAVVSQPVDLSGLYGTIAIDTQIAGGVTATTSSYTFAVPVGGTTYTVLVTSATSDLIVVTVKDSTTKAGTCTAVSAGVASCTMATAVAATTVTVKVDGTGTLNGAFFFLEME